MNRDPVSSLKRAFTILELCSVILVIGLLAAISIPVYSRFKARAAALNCVSNLKSLYAGAAAYTSENESWPQIAPPNQSSGQSDPASREYATRWIKALNPYGVTDRYWRCPSVEADVRKHGGEKAVAMPRLDYNPTRFGTGAFAPFQWTSHPWFIERGAPHTGGPLIILTDGSVVTVEDLMRRARR